MPGVFLTGTDTGAGKTFAACALLHALRGRGLRAVGMKPVASGCEDTADGLRNADALALQAASDPLPAYARVNPWPLRAATAPEIAAALDGVRVGMAEILAAYRELAEGADHVVVEGVGGWLAPLAADLDQDEVVRALELPVLLVVGLRLGCINHARLSAEAIRVRGCRLAGWIASAVDPQLEYADEYFAALARALPAPCLGRIEFQATIQPSRAAAALDPAPLFAAWAQSPR
jgi:dethiobiotin synthetase